MVLRLFTKFAEYRVNRISGLVVGLHKVFFGFDLGAVHVILTSIVSRNCARKDVCLNVGNTKI